jgi:hypothetical protein
MPVLPNFSPKVEPPVSCLSDKVTRQLQREASSPGHFAALILPNILPEIFGPTNKGFLFNWNGTGGKQKRCLQKKEMIHKIVISSFKNPGTRPCGMLWFYASTRD